VGEAAEEDRVDWLGLPAPGLVRAAAGLLAAAFVAALGALILGEYEFEGTLPLVAGLLFGLVIAEVAIEVGRRRTWAVGVTAGLLAATGLAWAGWISSGEGLNPMPGGAWLAAGLAFLVAVGRTVAGGRRAD
jgi:peptidoglycan/LPS O-acetylase OafA/YrhL